MSVISTRPARPDDARTIASIHIDTWRVVYRGHMPDELLDGLDLEKWAEKRRGWIVQPQSPRHRVLVAERDGEIVAFAAIGPERDGEPEIAGEIYAIYAHPDHWGTGTGRVLVKASIAQLRRDGFIEASLWVLDANERARRFYEAAGFALDGGEKTELFGGSPLRELRYRRASVVADLDLPFPEG